MTSKYQLLPLWIWLAMAVLTSFLGTPPDPWSMLMALAYGLLSFGIGAMLGSSLHVLLQILLLAVWVTITCLPIIWGGDRHIMLSFAATCYGLASIAMGIWACCCFRSGRLRILSGFCIGYAMGLIFFDPLGPIVGAVLGALLAKRFLPLADRG
jgi:hypothetical protein